MSVVKGYDSKSHNLARHFMQDRPQGISDKEVRKFTHDLALHIQQAVEDWFEDRGRSGWIPIEAEPCHGPQDTVCPSCGLGNKAS